MLTARVDVRLKRGVADPEGENTLKALSLLGFDKAVAVRSIRSFEIDLQVEDERKGAEMLREMCKRLLANPVIHDSTFQIGQVRQSL